MKLINQRSVFTWLTSLLIAMSLSACSGSSGPDDGGDGGTETFELVLGQAGGSIDGSIALNVNEITSLSATWVGSEGTTQNVAATATWVSSNTAVAEVTAGTILAKTVGMTQVTVSYDTDTVQFQVSVSAGGSLSTSDSTLSIPVGQSRGVTLIYTDVSGNSQDVSDQASWTANVNGSLSFNGNSITANQAGSYVATASYQNVETSILVTATAVDGVVSCSLSQPSYSVGITSEVNLIANCQLDDMVEDISSSMLCVSSDLNVLSIQNSTISGVSAGNASVTCTGTSTFNDFNYNLIATVAVTDICPTVEMLTIASSATTITTDETAQLTATYVSGCDSSVVNPVWTVTSGAITPQGLFTPDTVGSVTITASNAGVQDSITIDVTAAEEGVVVFFKKPSDWVAANAYAWYFEDGSDVAVQPMGEWPGSAMDQYEGDWYKVSIPETEVANFVFNEGLDMRQTPDLTDVEGGWYDGQTNQWLTTSPFGIGVAIAPCGASFSTATYDVVLNLSGPGATGEYTLSNNTTSFANGDTVTISGLSVDESTTIVATATDATGATATESCTFTRIEQPDQVDADTLGAVYSANSTTFSIWSPQKSNVSLSLAGQNYPMAQIPDANGYTNVYSVTVPGDHHLATYNFVLNGTAVRDPYGVMVVPGTDQNVVIDLARTEPAGGWAPLPALVEREDAVIYEVHVRDFSIHTTSGVSDQNKGKFLGMVEAGTSYQGQATGLDHLKELGVTHVQILPFDDYGTCSEKDYPNYSDNDGCYNWGYDPENFNVPEERYATDRNDYENRVRELKETINELHKNGIRVIMDVVYNHSWSGNANTGGETMLSNITDDYFWPTDLSGTGNATDPRNPMVSRMIRDSMEYWVTEYNLDGFRFDLVGIFDHEEFGNWADYLNTKYPERNLLIYGEPWNGFAEDPAEAQRVRMGTIGIEYRNHVGVFNGQFRDAIKGNLWDGEVQQCGFMVGNGGQAGAIEIGVRGSIRQSMGEFAVDTWASEFANDPEQSINYVSAHDNYGLRDHAQRSFDFAGTEGACDPGFSLSSAHHQRISIFAHGTVLTAQGMPFIHAGAEMFRTKLINGDWHAAENSYNVSDAVNAIDWSWKVDHENMVNYNAELIKMRRAHPGFRMNTWAEINDNVNTYRGTGRNDVVIADINGAANGDSWSRILVIYNPGSSYTHTLPSGDWTIAVLGESAGLSMPASGSVDTEGTSVTVLYQD